MKPHEMSCGLELEDDAEVSELLGELGSTWPRT